MFEVIEKSRENMTKAEIYNIVRQKDVKAFKSLKEDVVYTAKDWVIFCETGVDGIERVILSILLDNNEVIAGNSLPFRNAFVEKWEYLADNGKMEFKMERGRSKGGREYVTAQ